MPNLAAMAFVRVTATPWEASTAARAASGSWRRRSSAAFPVTLQAAGSTMAVSIVGTASGEIETPAEADARMPAMPAAASTIVALRRASTCPLPLTVVPSREHWVPARAPRGNEEAASGRVAVRM